VGKIEKKGIYKGLCDRLSVVKGGGDKRFQSIRFFQASSHISRVFTMKGENDAAGRLTGPSTIFGELPRPGQWEVADSNAGTNDISN
jgi:hypothetical protein